MEYKIQVEFWSGDKKEKLLIIGEDVNDVLNRVVDVQYRNSPIYNRDERVRKNLKKEAAKTASENIKIYIENESNLLATE